jgi:hypothetical protein
LRCSKRCSGCRRLDLGQKPIRTERRAEIGVQHLDGHIALVTQVVREIHGGHAAGAELVVNAVAVVECGGESRQHIAHARTLHVDWYVESEKYVTPEKCTRLRPPSSDARRALLAERYSPSATRRAGAASAIREIARSRDPW